MARFDCINKIMVINDDNMDVLEIQEGESTFTVRMSSGKDYVFSTKEDSYYPISQAEFDRVLSEVNRVCPCDLVDFDDEVVI